MSTPSTTSTTVPELSLRRPSLPIVLTSVAPFDLFITAGPRVLRTDDTVTGHVSGTLLLGHEAPATGGCGATSRMDRRVTLKAHRARG